MTTKTIFNKPKQKKPVQSADSSEVKSQEPIIPMSKVSLDVIKKLQTQPYPQLNLATHSTISEALQLYFNEYVRLFRQNQTLNDQLASILLQRNNLADQFNQIKKMKSYDDNIRRRRRYASQIERNYHCPMAKCNKGYGSQGSLTHHVRLKHPKFFESGEYEIYLQTYILPKQQIKNEDGKQLINVEEIDGQIQRVHKGNNKIEIGEDNVKQAKQQENIVKNTTKKRGDDSRGHSQKQSNNKNSSTPLMQSLMRQVDGYIVLQDNHEKQIQQSKRDEPQLETNNNHDKDFENMKSGVQKKQQEQSKPDVNDNEAKQVQQKQDKEQ